MDRLEAMFIFLAVVDEGSLAGAARRLGCPAASVTRGRRASGIELWRTPAGADDKTFCRQ
jgi:hypothetical protein